MGAQAFNSQKRRVPARADAQDNPKLFPKWTTFRQYEQVASPGEGGIFLRAAPLYMRILNETQQSAGKFLHGPWLGGPAAEAQAGEVENRGGLEVRGRARSHRRFVLALNYFIPYPLT